MALCLLESQLVLLPFLRHQMREAVSCLFRQLRTALNKFTAAQDADIPIEEIR